MFVLGLVKFVIIDSVKSGRVYFDMYGFLINVIFVDFNFLGMCQYSVRFLEDFQICYYFSYMVFLGR